MSWERGVLLAPVVAEGLRRIDAMLQVAYPASCAFVLVRGGLTMRWLAKLAGLEALQRAQPAFINRLVAARYALASETGSSQGAEPISGELLRAAWSDPASSCVPLEAILRPFFAGEASRPLAPAMRQHLSSCSTCHWIFLEVAQVDRVLGEGSYGSVLVDTGLNGSVAKLLGNQSNGILLLLAYAGQPEVGSMKAMGVLAQGDRSWDGLEAQWMFRHWHLIEGLLEPAVPSISTWRGNIVSATTRTWTVDEYVSSTERPSSMAQAAVADYCERLGRSEIDVLQHYGFYSDAMRELAMRVERGNPFDEALLTVPYRSKDAGSAGFVFNMGSPPLNGYRFWS